jgi:hypothetical protein
MTHITQIAVSNTVTTTRFLLLIYWTYTGHQLRVQIKEIKFLTLMHVLLDLQHPAALIRRSDCRYSGLGPARQRTHLGISPLRQ